MGNEIAVTEQSMLDEVLQGLKKSRKQLPSKFFYDERGSELFEQITDQQEYYPTRTEKKILRDNIDAVTARIGKDSVLVELGSGSSKKTRLLLDHMPTLSAYIPVDISEQYLKKIVSELQEDYPRLLIKPLCADYTKPLTMPVIERPHVYYILFYPGSTIGNFQPGQARKFLQTLSGILNPGGGLLIGVDLKKDRPTLEAAYNDRKGITAAFNKNMLVRLNRELNTDFDIDKFTHHAYYNDDQGRIEMHLISTDQQKVHVDGETVLFGQGESIHTENSYKYSLTGFEDLVSDWFTVEKVWTDEHDLFSLQYLKRR